MLTQEQLEWIVSEVVRRLKAAGATPAAGQAEGTPRSLTLTCRLVTLETLRGKLGSVSAVQVPGKAVVTPAVVDELKERKIRLIRV